MKKFKLFVSVTAALVMMLVFLGAQAASPLAVTENPYTGKIIVQASFDGCANREVLVEVIPSDVDAQDLSISSDALADSLKNVAYFSQKAADANGTAVFEFPLENSGSYSVFVHCMYAKGEARKAEIQYYSLSEARSAWASLVADPENYLPVLLDILNVTDENIIAHENDDYLHELISEYDITLSDDNFNADSAAALVGRIAQDCTRVDNIRSLLTVIADADSPTQINAIVTVEENAALLEVDGYMARYNALSNTRIADLAVTGETYTRAHDFAAAFAEGIDAAEASQEKTTIVTTPSKPSVGRGGTSLGGAVSAPVVAVPSHPFDDIADVQWAAEAISALYNKGIINGKAADKFAPNDNITREEFVKLAVGLMGIEPSAGDSAFADIDSSAWYAPYVNAAVSAGVINGYSASQFGVGAFITRQDAAVILDRIHGLAATTASASFADSADISDYAKDAVNRLSASGVINGSNGSFMPKSNCTRAEVACMVYRMMSLKEGK